ncbi:MAG: helix-turn-helix transcriptional regulator [bacterium]|nr:helix-turn-helix transcriptional regulator [bacterium]
MIPSRTDMEKALASAAEEPLATLHQDREHFERHGEASMAAVLAFLTEHLFEGGVTAVTVASAGATNDRTVSRRLRAYNGQTLSEYIAALQFETAINWLRADPEIEVDVVAEWVGLTGWRLRRMCKEWLCEPPSSCRLKRPFDPKVPAAWHRVARGHLTPAEQQQLVDYVRDTWPAAYEAACCAGPAPPSNGGPTPILATGRPQPILPGAERVHVVDREFLVRSFAENQLWPLLSDLDYGAQREMIARYPFTSPALFDLLRQKSREQRRRNPQRGIELAELALLSLDVSADFLGERIHELRALGWAWLGDARRFVLDFPGAEATFEKAMEELALVKGWEDSVVAADIYELNGSLRIFQRRFKEAVELLDRSLSIFEKTGDRQRQAEALMARAAAASYAGWTEMIISDLTTALGVVNELKADDLKVKVVISLGMALVNSGEFERGAAVVKAVDSHSCELVNPLVLHQVQWVEGIAEHGLSNHALAEEKYLEARAGFEALGQPLFIGFVDLDISILYTETRRPAHALRTSEAALSFFETLTLGGETMLKLGLLKDALHQQTVTTAVLRDLRCSLRADPLAELSKKAETGPKSPGSRTIADP